VFTVTVFIFQSRTAWTLVVTTYSLFLADRLCHLLFSGVEVVFFGHSCRRPHVLLGSHYISRLWCNRARLFNVFRFLLLSRNTSFEQEAYDFFIHTRKHAFEQVESLHLVDDDRVFLFINSILNRLFQIIHLTQVLFPCLVNQSKHNAFLKGTEYFTTFRFYGLLQVGRHSYASTSIREWYYDIFNHIATLGQHIGQSRQGLRCNVVGFRMIHTDHLTKELIGQRINGAACIFFRRDFWIHCKKTDGLNLEFFV